LLALAGGAAYAYHAHHVMLHDHHEKLCFACSWTARRQWGLLALSGGAAYAYRVHHRIWQDCHERLCSVCSWTALQQWALLGLAGGAAYAYHAHHMLYVLFDYGLNVTICMIIGLSQVRVCSVCNWNHVPVMCCQIL